MTEIIYRDFTSEEIAEHKAWEVGAYEREIAQIEQIRQLAYQQEADPLFFKWQAGNGTKEEWLTKRLEIAERYPYPEKAE